jgi:aminobenzoyl-glutamate utilization protein B
MAAHGLFESVDAVIAWHPRAYTTVEWDSGPGCYQARLFDFTGVGAYAALPWAGVSALDAAMLMNVAVQFMREHIPRQYLATVNEIITRGGQHPTSLPTNAQVWYVSRSPDRDGIDHIDALLTRSAEAACLVTGAAFTSNMIAATRPWLPNHVLAKHCFEALENIGAPTFSGESKDFGRHMLAELGHSDIIEPFDETVTHVEAGATSEFAGGADDVTEFTWHAPTARIYVAYGLRDGKWPNWTGAALAATPAAHSTIRTAAAAVALSTVSLLDQPDTLALAAKEFSERKALRDLAPLLKADWRLPDDAVVPS